jgi:trans-2,3-dihydro-3-hydroxyanthranilate isomerase
VENHFYIVDVFTEQPYSGNPLAVVVGEQKLSVDAMQKIAAEMNFSETTFVIPEPEVDGGYRTRIFTPSKEIAFAGHPILGTAQVLREHINLSASELSLNLSAYQVSVAFEKSQSGKEVAWFLAPSISFGMTSSCEPVAFALGIPVDDIETKFPVQVISAATSALVVPLRNLTALKKCMLNLENFAPMAAEGFPPLVYLFCPETHFLQNDLCARFFFEAHGVREDPATGNGAAFLGAYLLAHEYYPNSDLSLKIEQGYEIRRPSLINLRACVKNGAYEIRVGGCVVPVVQGKLL